MSENQNTEATGPDSDTGGTEHDYHRHADRSHHRGHSHPATLRPATTAAGIDADDEEPSGLLLVWRPLRWVLLAILVVVVTVQVLGTLDRTMEVTQTGGGTANSKADADAVKKASPGAKVEVAIQGLNLRTQPSVGGGVIIRKLSKGTTVNLIAQKEGWFQVQTSDGTKGWVVNRDGYSKLLGK